MTQIRKYSGSHSIIGSPAGCIALDALPSETSMRWTARRKGEIVTAIEARLLTFGEACARYSISGEELTGWQEAVRRSGVRALRVTHLQDYRSGKPCDCID